MVSSGWIIAGDSLGKPSLDWLSDEWIDMLKVVFEEADTQYFAKVGLDELDKIPEMGASYPEFSMFKELPAWGFFIRHAEGITFENGCCACRC